jgi:hypothetical protein
LLNNAFGCRYLKRGSWTSRQEYTRRGLVWHDL